MDFQSRKLPRLKNYDYSAPGVYFITICTHNRQCLFGNVVFSGLIGEASVSYSPIGNIAKQCLLDIESHYDNVRIDHWVIMPNHIHLLVRIEERINPFPTIRYDIPNIIGKYKAAVTRTAGNACIHSQKLWQASFYDHVIRNEADYQQIWHYISGNPSKWQEDCFYCE